MAASNKKFNLTELLNQRSKDIAPQGQQEAKEKDTAASVMADIYDLIPSSDNFYSVEDVKDLKQSIELLGVLQPLLVTNEGEDGKRRIIAGHRRRLAVMQLVDEGKERFRNVPIMVKPTKNAILDRLALIMANRFREKTDWEKMTESIETEKLVQELKEQMDIPGRTRDLLAEIVDASPAQLGRYKAIYNNLAAELMAEFKAGKIGVSVIYEVSGLEKGWQGKALELYRENGTLALPDVKELKRRQEEAAGVPGQMNLEVTQGQQEAPQTDETAAGEEIHAAGEETAAGGAGEAQKSLCETCEHNGECAGKKTHDSGCMGYERKEDFMNQPEEYEDPQPESVISLCYSCTRYETCHEKKATVTSCNTYEDRREAHKTEEQRYSEEQAKIDAETRKKLRDRQQEEAMQQGPAEKDHEEVRISPSRYGDIINGALSFLLLKKDGYKVGETLTLAEYTAGQETGEKIYIAITYVWEDWTGLEDDYCIIGFLVEKVIEKAVDWDGLEAKGAGE